MAQGFGNLEEAKSSEVDDSDAEADFCSTDGDKDITFSLTVTEPPWTVNSEAVDNLVHYAATSKSKKPVKNLTILPPPPPPFTHQDDESELPSSSACHKLCNLPRFLKTFTNCDLSDSEHGLASSASCAVKRENINYAGLEELKAFTALPHGKNENNESSLHLLQNSLQNDNKWKDNVLFHSFATSPGRFGPGIDTLLQDEKTGMKCVVKKVIEGTDLCKEIDALSRVHHQNVDGLMGLFHTNRENWFMFNFNEHQDFPRDQIELGHVFEGLLLGTIALHEKGMRHWNLDPAHLCYDGSTIKITGITDNFPDFSTEPERMYATPETACYILLHTKLVANKKQLMQSINPTELQDLTAFCHIYLAALVYMYIQSGHHPLVDIVTGGRDWDKFDWRKRDVLSLQLLQMVAELPDILQRTLKKLLKSGPFKGLLQQMIYFEAEKRPTLTQALKEIKEILVQLTRNSLGNEEADPAFYLNRAHGRDSLLEEQGHNTVWMNENQNHFWESKKDNSCLPHENIQGGQRDKISHPTQRRSNQTCGNLPVLSLLFNTEPI
ncbi:hypothetical protein ACJMK2_016009 [Sinanodonta woodiana]|uniref:Protein kinase domain-containing protein n=1 Tax=Sinanodonta woodiana TaxID=1069815 RepID=A0ABD3US88_SINWO